MIDISEIKSRYEEMVGHRIHALRLLGNEIDASDLVCHASCQPIRHQHTGHQPHILEMISLEHSLCYNDAKINKIAQSAFTSGDFYVFLADC